MHPASALAAAVALVLLVGGCTAGSDDEGAAPAPTASSLAARTSDGPSSDSGKQPTTTPAPTPKSSPGASADPDPSADTGVDPPVHFPVSVPALIHQTENGHDLQLGDVLATSSAYTTYAVTYRGDGLRLSAVLDLPDGDGPFPVMVLAHGYIDPGVYVTGQGLRRERDLLARSGYAVLAVDYRNHASSDSDPDADVELRLGYATDVINAVLAIKRAHLPRVDASHVGLLGRSMGGGVVLTALVVRPGLVDAAVVYSSVSSLAADNFDRWIRHDPGREGTAAAIAAAYGLPEDAPEFWREASPRPFFERVTEPVLVQHGTADDTCPVAWARATTKALDRAGADVRLIEWEGAPHAFIAEWGASMDRTLEFLDARLGGQEGP